MIFSVADPGSHFVIEFLPVRIEGEPLCLEHSALAPSDLQFARFLAGFTARPRGA